MGIGAGIFLVAVGAILAFAVNVDTAGAGVNLHTIGWILLGVGALGIVLSMVFWSSWGGPGYFTRRRTTTTNLPPGNYPPGTYPPGNYPPPPGTTTTIDQY